MNENTAKDDSQKRAAPAVSESDTPAKNTGQNRNRRHRSSYGQNSGPQGQRPSNRNNGQKSSDIKAGNSGRTGEAGKNMQNQRQSQPQRPVKQGGGDDRSRQNQNRNGDIRSVNPKENPPNDKAFRDVKKNNPPVRQDRIPDAGNRNRKKFQTVETTEDIRKENERLEKEIWLEIADIHIMKLD